MINQATSQIHARIKHLLGYPGYSRQELPSGEYDSLCQLDHFGLGNSRSRQEYLEFAEIDLKGKKCGPMKWCAEGLLE